MSSRLGAAPPMIVVDSGHGSRPRAGPGRRRPPCRRPGRARDLAYILYTSIHGAAEGVMLTHGNA